jgi:hypothetical protein
MSSTIIFGGRRSCGDPTDRGRTGAHTDYRQRMQLERREMEIVEFLIPSAPPISQNTENWQKRRMLSQEWQGCSVSL